VISTQSAGLRSTQFAVKFALSVGGSWIPAGEGGKDADAVGVGGHFVLHEAPLGQHTSLSDFFNFFCRLCPLQPFSRSDMIIFSMEKTSHGS
jgi:hypothetical protein